MVDLPHPDVPTNALLSPYLSLRLKFWNRYSFLDSYLNLMFSKVISPYIPDFISLELVESWRSSSSGVSRIASKREADNLQACRSGKK